MIHHGGKGKALLGESFDNLQFLCLAVRLWLSLLTVVKIE